MEQNYQDVPGKSMTIVPDDLTLLPAMPPLKDEMARDPIDHKGQRGAYPDAYRKKMVLDPGIDKKVLCPEHSGPAKPEGKLERI